MLDGKVYSLDELDAQLRANHLQMYDARNTPHGELHGTSAYGGMARGIRGIVKVVHSLDELQNIQSGDILVTQMISPNASHALRKIAALITDEGGLLPMLLLWHES